MFDSNREIDDEDLTFLANMLGTDYTDRLYGQGKGACRDKMTKLVKEKLDERND